MTRIPQDNARMPSPEIEKLVDLLVDIKLEEQSSNLEDDSNQVGLNTEETLDALQSILSQPGQNLPSKEEKIKGKGKTDASASVPKNSLEAAEIKNSSRNKRQFDQNKDAKAKNTQTSNNFSDSKLRDDPSLRSLIAELEKKLAKLEEQIHQPTDLVDPLIPLIRELLEYKEEQTKEAIVRGVESVVDEAIRQRFIKEPRKMSAALGSTLPRAIAYQIKQNPQEIAKAIAPEIALAIHEQIQLDREAISTTLGPEMGQAIKVQINQERDAMVDALYPVIGSTISKYMVEVVKSINEQVEQTLSVEGIKRKIRAKMQGVSEAELILTESIKYEVRAVLLIHKASGLVIDEVQPTDKPQLEVEMLAGMLTAIRSFVKDVVSNADDSEVHEIEYGDSKILIEVAGYCYLAVILRGEPTKQFRQKIRDTLGEAILKHDQKIEKFVGDRHTIPGQIHSQLEKLIETKTQEKKPQSPYTLIVLLAAIFGIIFVPWGIVQYRSSVAHRIETRVANALDAVPELSVYRLIPEVERGKLSLSGRVPNRYLKEQAGQVARAAAPNLELDNGVIAVDVPRDGGAIAAEVQRMTEILNQRSDVAISTEYREGTVTIEGIRFNQVDAQKITQSFAQIPGVRSVVTTLESGLPTLATKIYFDSNSTEFNSDRVYGQIATVKQFLEQHPSISLKILGHADPQGSVATNQKLALRRARKVEQALIAVGVDPTRLEISGTVLSPDATTDQSLAMSRYVGFETFLAGATDG